MRTQGHEATGEDARSTASIWAAQTRHPARPPGRLQGVLRVLGASHLRGLTQLALQLPAAHPLEALDLSHCHYLRELTLSCPRLRRANLSACRTLFRLRVRCGRERCAAAEGGRATPRYAPLFATTHARANGRAAGRATAGTSAEKGAS